MKFPLTSLVFVILMVFIISCAPAQTTTSEQGHTDSVVQAKDTEHDVPELPAEGEITNAEVTASESDVQVTAQMVDYYKGIEGYLAHPTDEGNYPGVVMIHEWWGLNDHIKDMAEQLAAEGYTVLAVDLYNGGVATTPDEARALVGAVDQDDANNNMKSAVDYLETMHGAQTIGSLGWCFGGKQSLQLSLTHSVDATVIYYGHLETDQNILGQLKGPVLGSFGSEDQSIPPAAVEAFGQSLDAIGHENDLVVYQGVGHAFANPSNAGYSPKDTQDAWARTTAFLSKNLK